MMLCSQFIASPDVLEATPIVIAMYTINALHPGRLLREDPQQAEAEGSEENVVSKEPQ